MFWVNWERVIWVGWMGGLIAGSCRKVYMDRKSYMDFNLKLNSFQILKTLFLSYSQTTNTTNLNQIVFSTTTKNTLNPTHPTERRVVNDDRQGAADEGRRE